MPDERLLQRKLPEGGFWFKKGGLIEQLYRGCLQFADNFRDCFRIVRKRAIMGLQENLRARQTCGEPANAFNKHRDVGLVRGLHSEPGKNAHPQETVIVYSLANFFHFAFDFRR